MKQKTPLTPLEGGSFLSDEFESVEDCSLSFPEEWRGISLRRVLIEQGNMTGDFRKLLVRHPVIQRLFKTFPCLGWEQEVPRDFLKRVKNEKIREEVLEKLFESRDLLSEKVRKIRGSALSPDLLKMNWDLDIFLNLRSAATERILDRADPKLPSEDELAEQCCRKVAERRMDGAGPETFPWTPEHHLTLWVEWWMAGKATKTQHAAIRLSGTRIDLLRSLIKDERATRVVRGLKRLPEVGFDLEECFGIKWSEFEEERQDLESRYHLAKKLGVEPSSDND